VCLCERGASGDTAGGMSVYVHVCARVCARVCVCVYLCVCVCVKGVQVGI